MTRIVGLSVLLTAMLGAFGLVTAPDSGTGRNDPASGSMSLPMGSQHTQMAAVRAQVARCRDGMCEVLRLVRHGGSWFAVPAAEAANGGVAMIDYQFSPANLTITAGDTITWTNMGAAPHTTASDPGSAEVWDSGNMNPGQAFAHTFTTAGGYSLTTAPTMPRSV